MNERIQELAEQAGFLVDRSGSIMVSFTSNGDSEVKKFAELIVRECLNRIEQNRSSGENTDSWTITRDMAFQQMKEDLREHFGVTE